MPTYNHGALRVAALLLGSIIFATVVILAAGLAL